MSDIRKCFTSRFNNGYIVEADFSQIEIICQAFLCNDTQMKQDVRDNIDFHCKRLAYVKGEDYTWVYNKCHVEKDPIWTLERKKIKSFSFQRSYGAGAKSISESLKVPKSFVEAFIEAENEMYPNIQETQEKWIEEVRRSRVTTKSHTQKGYPRGKGFLRTKTGRIYTFYEDDLPDWLASKTGHAVGFKPTQIKNYPVQGFAGELLHAALGRLYRRLKKLDLYGKALLINTVHDSILLDVRGEYLYNISTIIKNIMEDSGNYMNHLFPELNFDLPLNVEIKAGRNWGEMEDITEYT